MSEQEAPSRGYVDLCARPASTDEALSMLGVYRRLGYTIVGVEAGPYINRARVEREAAALGLTVVWRATIRAAKPRDISRRARDARRRAHIVAVSPSTLEAARYAARLRDVDLLAIEPGMERVVDEGTLELFGQRGWGAAEVMMLPVLRALEGPDRRFEAVLRYLFVSARRACGYKIPLAISSCAETRWDVFHPLHITGLVSLSGVPFEEALRWVSSVPRAIAVGRISRGS